MKKIKKLVSNGHFNHSNYNNLKKKKYLSVLTLVNTDRYLFFFIYIIIDFLFWVLNSLRNSYNSLRYIRSENCQVIQVTYYPTND